MYKYNNGHRINVLYMIGKTTMAIYIYINI